MRVIIPADIIGSHNRPIAFKNEQITHNHKKSSDEAKPIHTNNHSKVVSTKAILSNVRSFGV